MLFTNSTKPSLKRVKTTFFALGMSSILLATLAACSTGVSNKTETTPTETSSPISACAALTKTEIVSLGDVIPTNTPVTDEFGTYCKTKINPKSLALIFNPTKVDTSSLETYGFTIDDAQEAQKNAVTLFADQGLDSTILDNYTEPTATWVKENEENIAPKWRTDLAENMVSKNGRDQNYAMTGFLPEPVERNGEPRATKTKIELGNIYASTGKTEDSFIIVVEMHSTSTYAYPNDVIIDYALKSNPSLTEVELKRTNPSLFTDAQNFVTLKGTMRYGYNKDNLTQIVGYGSNYALLTNEGTVMIDYDY